MRTPTGIATCALEELLEAWAEVVSGRSGSPGSVDVALTDSSSVVTSCIDDVKTVVWTDILVAVICNVSVVRLVIAWLAAVWLVVPNVVATGRAASGVPVLGSGTNRLEEVLGLVAGVSGREVDNGSEEVVSVALPEVT